MDMTSRGIAVDIYRNANRPGDCTLNGISRRYDRVVVIGVVDDRTARPGLPATPVPVPADCRLNSPHVGACAAFLRIRTMGPEVLYSIEPYHPVGSPRPWYMFGGNYAASSDGRWADLAGRSPVAVHDRREG